MWPRHYYAQIRVLPQIEWKDAILNDVPPHLQEFVRKYLRIDVMRRKHESSKH